MRWILHDTWFLEMIFWWGQLCHPNYTIMQDCWPSAPHWPTKGKAVIEKKTTILSYLLVFSSNQKSFLQLCDQVTPVSQSKKLIILSVGTKFYCGAQQQLRQKWTKTLSDSSPHTWVEAREASGTSYKPDGIFSRCLCRRYVVTSTSKGKHWQSRSTLTVTHEEHFLLSYTATHTLSSIFPRVFTLCISLFFHYLQSSSGTLATARLSLIMTRALSKHVGWTTGPWFKANSGVMWCFQRPLDCAVKYV